MICRKKLLGLTTSLAEALVEALAEWAVGGVELMKVF
jgi:hypothetical protein